MKTLEEMQQFADAIETIEIYQNKYWAKAFILTGKIIANIAIGFLIYSGAALAKYIWGPI